IGDSSFVTNASLARGSNARVLLEALNVPKEQAPDPSVALVDHRLAAGADNPYRALVNSGMAPLLFHGIVFLFLLALAKGAPFGARRELVLPPRRAFSEHVQAIGRLYARSRASRHALAAYASWAFDRLNARLRPGAALRLLDLGKAIAQTTGRSEEDVART